MTMPPKDTVTVDEVKLLSHALGMAIERLVQEFEMATGCYIHSIPVTQAVGGKPLSVIVKVQITEPR
jgi:hypothetical protein